VILLHCRIHETTHVSVIENVDVAVVLVIFLLGEGSLSHLDRRLLLVMLLGKLFWSDHVALLGRKGLVACRDSKCFDVWSLLILLLLLIRKLFVDIAFNSISVLHGIGVEKGVEI